MRLLIVSQYFWPETFIINDLARLLHARGIEVTVLTGKPNYPGGDVHEGYRAGGVQRECYEGIEIIRMPLVPRGQNSRVRLVLNYLSFLAAASTVGPFSLRGRAFDAVLVYGVSPLLQALSGVVLSSIKKAPLVVWVQDLWPESLSATGYIANRAVLKMVSAVVRSIYRSAAMILIQSAAFRARVEALCDNPNKIVYYPNLYQAPPTDAATAGNSELADALRRKFSVVFAGNIGTAQDPETILQAARLLKSVENIRIVLVGSGSREKWLAESVTDEGLENLVLAGRVPSSHIPHIFEAASALLVTLAPQPIFGLTIPSRVQAYLAAGRPVVGALDGEPARIIAEARAGICVPAGNAEALAGAILQLHAMSDVERDTMGERGKAYFERNFAPDKLTTDLITLLEGAIVAREKVT